MRRRAVRTARPRRSSRWRSALGVAAVAQPSGAGASSGLGAQDNGKPIDIEADDGIEWQQNNRVYIARGNATATRGQSQIPRSEIRCVRCVGYGCIASGTSGCRDQIRR